MMLWWRLRQLKSETVAVRARAAEKLARSGDRRAVSQLVLSLADPEESVRKAAAAALDRIDAMWSKSPEASAAVPDLVNKTSFRLYGPVLRQIGNEDAVDCLAGILTENRSGAWRDEERNEAVKVLGQIGTRRAVEKLLPHLPVRWMHDSVADALREAGDVFAIDGLVAVLPEFSSPVAEQALDSLDPAWPKREAARSIVSALVAQLPHPGLAPRACRVLDRIDPKWTTSKDTALAVPGIVESLVRKTVPTQRETIIAALARIDPHWTRSEAVRMQLVNALGSRFSEGGNSGEARRGAEEVLREIDPGWPNTEAARRAIPRLLAAVRDSRGDTLRVLDLIRSDWPQMPEAKEGVALLIADLPTGQFDEPRDVVTALTRIGRPAILELVLDMANWNHSSFRRRSALDALRAIDPLWTTTPEARSAMPHLFAATRSYVRAHNLVKADDVVSAIELVAGPADLEELISLAVDGPEVAFLVLMRIVRPILTDCAGSVPSETLISITKLKPVLCRDYGTTDGGQGFTEVSEFNPAFLQDLAGNELRRRDPDWH